MTLSIIGTVVLGVILVIALGTAVAGALSDDPRADKIGGIAILGLIAALCIVAIAAIWRS